MLYRRHIKRLLDLILVIPALILLVPLFVGIAILVRIKLGTPVLFRQQRPGLHGKPFTIYKFRTMADARDPAGNLLPVADRLTEFGRFLRSSSLDELPELVNVLKGDMSLVGPRPLRMHYLPHYTPQQMRRHHVLPGITGWAQINGRNAVSWDDRFQLDGWYVDNISLALDLKIIVSTLIVVFRREGISAAGQATVRPFIEPREEQHT